MKEQGTGPLSTVDAAQWTTKFDKVVISFLSSLSLPNCGFLAAVESALKLESLLSEDDEDPRGAASHTR